MDWSFDLALSVAAVWVGGVSLTTGLVLVRRRTTYGPPHPFASAYVSGLLLGVSVLVVLPEALDNLPAWTSSQVLALFLCATLIMFFLDHSVMEHQHVAGGERILTAITTTTKSDVMLDPAVWKDKADEVPVWVTQMTSSSCVDSDPTATVQVQSMSRPDIEQLPSTAPPPPAEEPAQVSHDAMLWCPCHGPTDPFGKGTGFSFGLTPIPRVCPLSKSMASPPPSLPSPPPSPPVASDDLESSSLRADTKLLLQQRSCSQVSDPKPPPAPSISARRIPITCAVAIRVCAWMLHAMIDGMVLASAPSTLVLIATTAPISVCAIQDVTAFTITIARVGLGSQRCLTAGVVALSCAFPIGALASHAVLLGAATSSTAINVARTIVAGVFSYMALFELSPPHTHNRAANACYSLCFTCGAATAYAADVAQQLTMQRR